MTLTQETVDHFQRLMKENKEIRLINVYKGLPVSYPAKIMNIESNSLHLKTERMQVVCLYRDHETYIQAGLPKTLHAHVLDLNVDQSEVLLHNFRTANWTVGRAKVRVEPREFLRGEIIPEKRFLPINCNLLDISVDGAGLYIDQDHYSSVLFGIGQEVTIHLNIPLNRADASTPSTNINLPAEGSAPRFSREDLRGIQPPAASQSSWVFNRAKAPATHSVSCSVSLRGIIANVNYYKVLGRYRVGIKLTPSDPQRNIISQFLVQRQAEILTEMRQVASTII